MAGIYLDPCGGGEWEHGSAAKWKLANMQTDNLPHSYPDKQTLNSLILIFSLNKDIHGLGSILPSGRCLPRSDIKRHKMTCSLERPLEGWIE